MEDQQKYVDLLIDVIVKDYTLPAGFDSWGLKSVRPDLTTRGGFRYPWPGGVAKVDNMRDHDDSCPQVEGDGLCVAKTWRAMASGGIPARTLLLVAYRGSEARGNEPGKYRVPELAVVDVIDGEAVVRSKAGGANLRYANLGGADIQGAYLQRANLRYANLGGANLRYANLRYAYLRGADIWGAHLGYTDLRYAYLEGADLGGADLRYADLRDADLQGAYLRGADLQGANLQGANLGGADLTGAVNLEKNQLSSVQIGQVLALPAPLTETPSR